MAVAQEHHGTCHCESIGFVFRTDVAPEEWTIRACQCTFCRPRSAHYTADPGGTLRFFERTAGSLHRYQFGRKVTDFILCRNCGVCVGAMMQLERGKYGVINVKSLIALLDLQEALPMNFDSESTAERLARREERWTPATVG